MGKPYETPTIEIVEYTASENIATSSLDSIFTDFNDINF